jgi:hypothetical protein
MSQNVIVAPIPIKSRVRRIMALILGLMAFISIWASLVVAVSALFSVGRILDKFYLDTATIAPGTGIRPMGMEMQLGLTWTASILIGDVCALVGGIISLMQRRRLLVAVAVLAAIFAWVPMFYSQWGVNHIVILRKLVMEP